MTKKSKVTDLGKTAVTIISKSSLLGYLAWTGI